MRVPLLPLFILIAGLPPAGLAGPAARAPDAGGAIPYHTPEERREAGLGIELTPWLSVSALLEAESVADREHFTDRASDPWNGDTTTTGQMVPSISLGERWTGEVVLEWEDAGEGIVVDEWSVAFGGEGWDASIGRLYLPFGIYYSHFVTGPVLEFAESRAGAVQLDAEPADWLEASLYTFRGTDDGRGHETREWGASLEAKTAAERYVFGLGYVSGIAPANAAGFADADESAARGLGALNAYALARFDSWEMTFEAVCTQSAATAAGDRSGRPCSANLEAGVFIGDAWELAARLEYSRELPDTPQRRYGVSATWRANRHVSVSGDYLYGSFPDGAGGEPADVLRRREIVAARIAVEL